MTAKLTPNLRLRNAKDFIENLVNHPITPPTPASAGSHTVDRSHYIFIGRTKPWPTNLTPLVGQPVVSETSPPIPSNTLEEEIEARDHMIALKKVRDVDATLAVKRFNWDASGNTIYAQYDSTDPEIFNHPTQSEIEKAAEDGGYKAGSHYVITDEYHVFKCLSNNNGSKSVNKPTLPVGRPDWTVSPADGYVWKYLCTLTQFQVQYFLTNQWLPVKTLTGADDGSNQYKVQQASVIGSIDSFIIENGGNDYEYVLNGGTNTLISPTSNTATLPVAASPSLVDGAYVSCHIWITGGTGFPSGPFVITNYVANTRQITISGTWSVGTNTTFQILPRVVITGNGTGATAKAEVNSATKKISKIIPVDRGSGYTYAKVELIGGKTATGTLATVTAQIAPKGGHGADIERELNACYAMLTARLEYDDGSQDFPLSNDYRQIGLIRDVRTVSGSLANSMTLRASQAFRMTGVSTGVGGAFQPDEEIVGSVGSSSAKGKIIAIINGPAANEATIHYYQDSETGYEPFQNGMAITGSITGAIGNIPTGGTVSSEIDKLSGDILYIDNRRAILRAPNQTEILRAVIKF